MPIDGVDFNRYKIFEFIRSYSSVFFPVASCIMFFTYMALNINLLRRFTFALYVFCGYMNGASIFFIIVKQRLFLQKILNEIQLITDESKFLLNSNANRILTIFSIGMSLGNVKFYMNEDRKINQLFKFSAILWFISIISLVIFPFLQALSDYLHGNYSLDSWVLLYDVI